MNKKWRFFFDNNRLGRIIFWKRRFRQIRLRNVSNRGSARRDDEDFLRSATIVSVKNDDYLTPVSVLPERCNRVHRIWITYIDRKKKNLETSSSTVYSCCFVCDFLLQMRFWTAIYIYTVASEIKKIVTHTQQKNLKKISRGSVK